MLKESLKIPGRADVWVGRSENVNVLKKMFLQVGRIFSLNV